MSLGIPSISSSAPTQNTPEVELGDLENLKNTLTPKIPDTTLARALEKAPAENYQKLVKDLYPHLDARTGAVLQAGANELFIIGLNEYKPDLMFSGAVKIGLVVRAATDNMPPGAEKDKINKDFSNLMKSLEHPSGGVVTPLKVLYELERLTGKNTTI